MNKTAQRLFNEAHQLPSATAGHIRRWWRATHLSLSMTGLLVVVLGVALLTQPEWRRAIEVQMLTWLQARHDEPVIEPLQITTDPSAIERVTAASPADLPKDQANVALWLSRRYRVAPEPLSALVAEAFHLGGQLKLEPTLILAVMAIESRFNPYAQSPVGAQGLMQVMTRVHTDKYEGFGGSLAALDPVSNLRVGAQVLRDAIRRAGSVEGGLKLYVGAVTTDGSDYINKVMAEQLRLQSVALGQPLPKVFPVYTPPGMSPAEAAPTAPSDEVEADARQPNRPTQLPAPAQAS